MAHARSESDPRLADFSALDERGRPIYLSALAAEGALILLVHAGLAHARSVALLVEYRDRALSFGTRGVHIAALSADDAASLAFLRSERGIPFPLLSDPERAAMALVGPLARDGLAVLLIDRELRVLFRTGEPLGSSAQVLALIKRGVGHVRPLPFPRIAAALRLVREMLRQRAHVGP